MKKIQINDCICHSKIKNHLKIKDKILSEIEKSNDGYLTTDSDNISKLDWNESLNVDRTWVKIFVPEFVEDLKEILSSMCYTGINLIQVWYQQYLEGDTHAWHVHGQNFTGVYYLEFPEGCSKTEVCSPYDSKVIQVDAVEGDFIVFPSHYLHRGLPNKKIRKTIVSFNFDITSYTEPN